MTSFPEVIKLSEATWQVPWTGDACNWLSSVTICNLHASSELAVGPCDM